MNDKIKTSNHGNITFKEFETENFRICAKDKVQQDMIDGYFLLTLHTIFNLPDLGIIYHKYGIDKYLTKEEVIELRDVLTEIIDWWEDNNLENFPNKCECCKYLTEKPTLNDKNGKVVAEFEDDYCGALDEFIEEGNLEECCLKEVK